jgi:hypothetical protein
LIHSLAIENNPKINCKQTNSKEANNIIDNRQNIKEINKDKI